MSYKQCFFAIPADESFDNALAQFQEFAQELRFENDYEALYLVTNTEEQARAGGLRLLHLVASPAPYGRVPRGFFTDRWSGGALLVLVYDDQHGLFLWQRVNESGPTQSILTDGHRVGARNIELTVDYPQRGFTNAQLDEALQKPEQELTDAEARALMEYDDALTIGLRQLGSSLSRGALLDLLYAKQGFALLDEAGPQAVTLPRDAGAVADFYIESYEFSAHGLTPRYY